MEAADSFNDGITQLSTMNSKMDRLKVGMMLVVCVNKILPDVA